MLPLVLVIAFSATPAERHAVFLKTHLDGSNERLSAMAAEFDALDLHWAKLARSGRGAQQTLALKKRNELRLYFAEELEKSPVPPAIARLGEEAIMTYKDVLRERAAELRSSAP